MLLSAASIALWKRRESEAGAEEQAECYYRPPGKVVAAVGII